MKWGILTICILAFAAMCGPPMLGVIAVTSLNPPTSYQPPHQVDGIPGPLLDAYREAAQQLPRIRPDCEGMRWSILAGIGRIESTHAAGHDIDQNGDITPPFVGPRLDGSGVGGNLTPHYDSDNGELDGDTVYDRAVGPMQHLPNNWLHIPGYAHDGNDDGRTDPHNAYDATLTTAVYLCGTEPADLTDPEQLRDALYRYNPSQTYVDDVMAWIDTYDELGDPTASPRIGSGSGNAIIEAGEEWLGTPYEWGGDCNTLGQDRCDCSSLARYAYRHGAGIELPRTTYDQVMLPHTDDRFIAIPADDTDRLQPGDLLFFGANPPGGIYHVGLYISEDAMLEAPRTGLNVRIAPWQGRTSYYGAVGLR